MRARVGSQAKTENQTWQENEIGRGRSTERCRNGKSKITRDTDCKQPEPETKKKEEEEEEEAKKKKKSTIKF